MSADEQFSFTTEHKWKFAKSMPSWPHEYTVRANAPDPFVFERFVYTLRALGYSEPFRGMEYKYLKVGGWKYWTMGAPISETIIINRARL